MAIPQSVWVRAASAFAVASVASLSAAGFLFVTRDSAERGAAPGRFTVTTPSDGPRSHDITKPLIVTAKVENHSDEPIRVLSTCPSCGMNACFRAVDEESITVPPGGVADRSFEITVHYPESFGCQINLFVDDGELSITTFIIRGTGVSPKKDPGS